MKLCRKSIVLIVLFAAMVSAVSGVSLTQVEQTFESARTFQFQSFFSSSEAAEITRSTSYLGTISIQFEFGYVPWQQSALFVQTAGELKPYPSVEAYITSDDFLLTIQPSFRLRTNADAKVFQSFLYLIDEQYFHEGFFNEWYRDPRARGGPWRLRLRCRPKGRGISPYVSCTLSVMDQ